MVDSKWFVKKLGFGLMPEEGFPTDLISWAMDQTNSVPDVVTNPIPTLSQRLTIARRASWSP